MRGGDCSACDGDGDDADVVVDDDDAGVDVDVDDDRDGNVSGESVVLEGVPKDCGVPGDARSVDGVAAVADVALDTGVVGVVASVAGVALDLDGVVGADDVDVDVDNADDDADDASVLAGCGFDVTRAASAVPAVGAQTVAAVVEAAGALFISELGSTLPNRMTSECFLAYVHHTFGFFECSLHVARFDTSCITTILVAFGLTCGPSISKGVK